MKIIRAKDYQDMSRKAANIISAQVIMKPDCVLGLATGGTPVGTYAQLVDWYNKGDLDFSFFHFLRRYKNFFRCKNLSKSYAARFLFLRVKSRKKSVCSLDLPPIFKNVSRKNMQKSACFYAKTGTFHKNNAIK